MTDIADLCDRIATAIERDYVCSDRGREAAARLRSGVEGGALAAHGTLPEVAADVTALLQEATGDLHLRLIHHPGGVPHTADEESYDAHWSRHAARTAGGVRRVERTEDNVAVIGLAPFIGLPRHAGAWLSAAMALCAGADGVVIDLRDCVGGTPDGVALVCSYLVGAEPRHLVDVVDRTGVRQHWTLATVPGPRLPESCPVAVLVSANTFSGGEELAFHLQELGRAIVVGERTRGGAHPRIAVTVADELELALPVARPLSPRTGRNWEGSGVVPDLPCRAEEALAHALAWMATRQPGTG